MYNSGIGTPYWFEWEIGILECLRLLQDTSIESVVLQSTDFQVLDDVVVNYCDKSILNIQVKHTDVNDNLTYSFLASGEKPLLNALALEWRSNKEKYLFKGIQLVTNKKWGTNISEGKCSMASFVSEVFPCLQSDYNYSSLNPKEQKAIEWYKKTLEKSLDKNDAASFTKIFSFRKESCSADVEEKIRIQIGVILGVNKEDAIDFCLSSLLSQLRIWATSRRKKQEICREDVYAALCYSMPDVPSYELFPEKPILPSRQRYAETFINSVKNNENHIIFLEGLPGAGKTSFVSYLSQMNESIVDFRFYTYLPVNKINGAYSDDEGFYLSRYLWSSILVQLKKKFEEKKLLSGVSFPLIYQFMSVSEMRQAVIRFLPEYAKCIGRPCYFFIDGLDHAARSKAARDSFLFQLPRPEEIGDDLYFVLVGQPIHEGYPSWMINNNNITYFKMPALETDDVVVLLKQSGVAESNVDIENLAKTVISIIGNNVLNIIFAILELEKIGLPLSFEVIEDELNKKFLNKQIDKYYEWIIGSLDKSLLLYKIETIMAFASNRVNSYELAQMCEVEHDEVLYILNRLYPIIISEEGEYFAFHNDVKLFLQNEIIRNSNIKVISESIINRIQADKKLWKYRYDVSFNLLVRCKGISEVLQLIDVEYIMDSALYGISFDKIFQQFILAQQLPIEDFEDVCIFSSAVSLCLAQYANCIQYYEKETEYFEKQNISFNKTKSEKYCLSVESDFDQIVGDIYNAAKTDFERGRRLFIEYFGEYNIEELFKRKLSRKILIKTGYIYRCYGVSFVDNLVYYPDEYDFFIDGWLEAGTMFVSEDEIKQTFNIKRYHIDALSLYVTQIVEGEKLDEKAYKALLDILLRMSVSIDNVIELCTYGLLNLYDSKKGIEYIAGHIDEIKDINREYKYEDIRVIALIKAKFCLYGRTEKALIDDYYKEILVSTHNDESTRGYKPAIAQYGIASRVIEQFYSSNRIDTITKDDIFLMMYFADRFGTGPVHDCYGYTVMRFIRKVVVNYAKHNPKANIISTICKAVVQCLEWDKSHFVSEFNTLFCISNLRIDFLRVAEYWCGEEGVAWKSEYDDMESYCKSIIETLEYFEEYEFVERIRIKLKYKMFGYVGRKDYSIDGLLECYKKLPLSKEKLCDYGMRLFSVSNLANGIGDNRLSSEVDRELLDVAVKLGYKYCNALFELKNSPKDLVYWRMNVIDALYSNIDRISDDSELLALYKLTNAWIKEYIEQDRQYNRLETLKFYNSIVVSRISNSEIREELLNQGGCDGVERDDFPASIKKTDNYEILDLIKEEGYSNRVEKFILTQIEKRELGLRNMIIEAGKLIETTCLEAYANRCVVKYILFESEYGYISSGINELFEHYSKMFTEDSWKVLYADVVTRFTENDFSRVASLWGDFTMLSLYYLLQNNKEKANDLFNYLCETHERLSSANGRVRIKAEKLIIDDGIESLSDMVDFQLNLLGDAL